MEVNGKICLVFLVFLVSADVIFTQVDPVVRKIVEDCHHICKGIQDRPQCLQECTQKGYREQQKGQSRDTYRPETGHRQSNSPYVFEDDQFTARIETEQFNARFLEKFSKRSELFTGIENYRVAILTAEPQTFIPPNHWDADALIFVKNGRGTITLFEGNSENSRQSSNLKEGDLFLLPAGIMGYLINTDDNEQLVLAVVFHTISTPGELEFYNGKSFFNVFSHELLEAAFDVEGGSIRRIFGQQKIEEEVSKKATDEQIRSLAGGEDNFRLWPFGEKTKERQTSIYKKEPTVANENGILHEVNSKDFPALQAMNLAFSFFNITQGSIAGPFYNTRATQVLMVQNGAGRFEMACPHLSDEPSGGEIHQRYQKVSSELRSGMTIVIPPGHPVVIEAFGEQNLQLVGFGLNSNENEWYPLAGQNNVLSEWEDTALELTFGLPAKEVQKVIRKQNKKLFFKAPVRSGRAFA